jgi:hypothetical protein
MARDAPEEPWKPLDGFPLDGTPFVVLTTHTFRWVPYVASAMVTNKHALTIDGVLGRWQCLGDQNLWKNCSPPRGLWKSTP